MSNEYSFSKNEIRKAIETMNVVKKAIDSQQRKNKDAMTNAEYCIKNGIKFFDIQFQNRKEVCGGGYRFRDRKTGEYIGQIGIEKTEDGRPLDGNASFRAWLDSEHEDYKDPYEVLTGEERGYLKTLLKPFRTGSIKYIRRYYLSTNLPSLVISSTDYGDFMFPTGNLEFAGMEEGKEYKLQDLGIL